jgi:hypothetical protein
VLLNDALLLAGGLISRQAALVLGERDLGFKELDRQLEPHCLLPETFCALAVILPFAVARPHPFQRFWLMPRKAGDSPQEL